MAKNNDTKYSVSVFLCDNLQNGCQLKECYYLRKQNLIRVNNARGKWDDEKKIVFILDIFIEARRIVKEYY